MSERQLTAFAVTFSRTKREQSDWDDFMYKKGKSELGIYIGRNTNDPDGFIVDMEGKVVPAPIWDYIDNPHLGCFVLKEPSLG